MSERDVILPVRLHAEVMPILARLALATQNAGETAAKAARLGAFRELYPEWMESHEAHMMIDVMTSTRHRCVSCKKSAQSIARSVGAYCLVCAREFTDARGVA